MAQFTIEINEELLPGVVAELSTLSHPYTLEEYVSFSANELLRQRCEVYKVGPYYQGFIAPKFNADGSPYVAPAADAEPAAEDQDTTSGSEV